MKLDYVFAISGNLPDSMKRSLIYSPFSPQNSAHVQEGSVMKQVKKNDILLFYPYESMNPFLRLIKEASTDPNVLTIKITIYRLAKKARLVGISMCRGREWKRGDGADRASGKIRRAE